ncbi:MAG: GAF domain-containing protein [Pegethrix bostrychoides GSE-TBD4-15B]|jgi:adenylate cyclase|uniref:GAF domain-containing protein n=1 Tax=Pegethrix bostrychoides GSE-TBD4-15B TaxID=2839662 RepID=A0A951PEH9_9CYAN|nr:GAF domain-containing protein [Pegethrix bostrychoides GSE-TBD4-15B]
MAIDSSFDSVLAAFSNITRRGDLSDRVRDLPIDQFRQLLEQITQEFGHFLRAIDLINNNALESLLEQILEALTLKVGQLLRADRTTIFLVDEEKGQLWSKIAQGESSQLVEIRVPIAVGVAGQVARTGDYLNIPDAYSHPLFNRDIDRQTGYLTRNILCMPIFDTKAQVVAVVQMLNKSGEQPFDQADEALFREFADSMGIILESCNSFYMAARNQRGVTSLLKATAYLGQSLNLEKTLQAVMNEARDLMQADRSTLFLFDREQRQLWSKVATADGSNSVEIRIPADRGIAGYVASTNQTLNIPNAYEDPRFDPTVDQRTGYLTRTILCMPVYNSAGMLIGVTQLINKNQGCFNGSDEEFMRAFNIQAGIALENAQLFERVLLEQQYQKDMLQSLSDAVISTDLQGKIVTINNAALRLLGCPDAKTNELAAQRLTRRLVNRPVWEVVPIEHLQLWLEECLSHATPHYAPEQSLLLQALAEPIQPGQPIERSINLTVTPLSNTDGEVRGGLVVLEDISQEKRMKTTLYRYMTPDVAEQVMALGDDALMIGERRDVSILFSDIRGYTSLTEKMQAADVVGLLNTYFETMVESVFIYQGTLDKFIGDALMAVFGAPLPLENHAWMAVQSALDMRQRLQEFNQHRQSQSQPPIQVGIGISSGEVVSGNIGSQRRMDYTVIGDGVDISARLEGVTKEYGCDIILSEYTYQFCQERIWVRELDKVCVKGKTKPLRIYELIGERSEPLNSQTAEFIEAYEAGRCAYLNRRFQQALTHFEAAALLRPDDRSVKLQLLRTHKWLLEPPPPDWDGVYMLVTK